MPNETGFAPLGVLGYCLTRTQFLATVWAELDLGMKTVDHSPQDKLEDVVTSILAGCCAISQVNTRLCPDLALTYAWGTLAAFGTTRLIEDVFHLPGRLLFDIERLSEVQLNRLYPHAEAVAAGLERLLDHFGYPGVIAVSTSTSIGKVPGRICYPRVLYKIWVTGSAMPYRSFYSRTIRCRS